MKAHYTPDNYSSDESIGYLIGRARALMAASLDRALAECGMTHAQFGIFRKLLDSEGRMTAGELAREWNYDAGAMTRMLDRLEDKGFIERVRSKEDRRIVHVRLSRKGRALASRMSLITIETLNNYLRDFSPDEVAQFKQFLRRVISNA